MHILGCGSALPTLKHNATSQVVDIRGKLFMIDCGEGTQVQLRRSRIRFTKIGAVFISHLHGDHCFGLIGMISTFGLLGRTAALHVYAPAELGPMLRTRSGVSCHRYHGATGYLRRQESYRREHSFGTSNCLLWLPFPRERIVAAHPSRHDRLLSHTH